MVVSIMSVVSSPLISAIVFTDDGIVFLSSFPLVIRSGEKLASYETWGTWERRGDMGTAMAMAMDMAILLGLESEGLDMQSMRRSAWNRRSWTWAACPWTPCHISPRPLATSLPWISPTTTYRYIFLVRGRFPLLISNSCFLCCYLLHVFLVVLLLLFSSSS